VFSVLNMYFLFWLPIWYLQIFLDTFWKCLNNQIVSLDIYLKTKNKNIKKLSNVLGFFLGFFSFFFQFFPGSSRLSKLYKCMFLKKNVNGHQLTNGKDKLTLSLLKKSLKIWSRKKDVRYNGQMQKNEQWSINICNN
jgi:hypothetical protein